MPSALSAASAVEGYDPPFPMEEYKERRDRFMEQIDDGTAILLGAQSRADYLRFRQNNNFYYFTGLETPNSVLLLDGTSGRSTLYVPRFSERDIRVEGPQVQPGEEAAEAIGLDSVRYLDDLATSLIASTVFRQMGGGTSKIYISSFPEEIPAGDNAFMSFMAAQVPWDGALTREATLVRWLRDRVPLVEVASYDAIVHEMRRVKSAREIETMRKSGKLSAEAVMEAIRGTRPGRFEYEISALAEFVMKRGGAARLAWDNIVASGPNGNIWHYFKNNRKMESGDLVLADIGAEFDYYSTDITRSWPVGGRFTEEQKKIYDCVLEAHVKTIAAVKPGVTSADLNAIAQQVFEAHGFKEHAARGIGHLIGLSPHDVGSRSAEFVPGVVFNVEPIIDIPDQGLHIRLEDSVLVTETGHEVLTGDAPIDIESIYALYDEGSRHFEP
jgi:Xaa-Pro aminopeptidase